MEVLNELDTYDNYDVYFLLCYVVSNAWSDIAWTQYKPGALVVVQTNLMPQFGVIDDIIVVNSEECFFICCLLETHCFNHHFYCYEVTHLNPPEHLLRPGYSSRV